MEMATGKLDHLLFKISLQTLLLTAQALALRTVNRLL